MLTENTLVLLFKREKMANRCINASAVPQDAWRGDFLLLLNSRSSSQDNFI